MQHRADSAVITTETSLRRARGRMSKKQSPQWGLRAANRPPAEQIDRDQALAMERVIDWFLKNGGKRKDWPRFRRAIHRGRR